MKIIPLLLRRSILLSLVMLLSACTSIYKAPGLPTGGDGAIAILEPEAFERGAKFSITKIDGQFRGIGWFNRFELAPGRREITASVNPYSLKGEDITRFFTAVAGKKYVFVVNDDPIAKKWSFSIVERATGSKVDSTTR